MYTVRVKCETMKFKSLRNTAVLLIGKSFSLLSFIKKSVSGRWLKGDMRWPEGAVLHSFFRGMYLNVIDIIHNSDMRYSYITLHYIAFGRRFYPKRLTIEDTIIAYNTSRCKEDREYTVQ